MRANVELSPELHQYLNLLNMEGYKPTTHAERQMFAKDVTDQIKKDYEPPLWPIVTQFVSQCDKHIHPYFYELKDQLK